MGNRREKLIMEQSIIIIKEKGQIITDKNGKYIIDA